MSRDDKEDKDLRPSTGIETEWAQIQPGYPEMDLPPDGFESRPEDVLRLLTRDFRLGRISSRKHDVNWHADRLDVAMGLNLLRGGVFRREAIACVATAAAITESGLSIDGFLRQNQRTIRKSEESTFEDKGGGGGVFGLGKKKNKVMY